MISVVIMIIVIIIIAAVAIYNSTRPINEASETRFLAELAEVKKGVNVKRIANSKKGSSEEILNQGFIKVYVNNAPEGFVSFDSDSVTGYVVDLATIEYDKISSGQGYLDLIKGDTIDFNVDDVYIYDAAGNIFYAKGYVLEDGNSYYTDDSSEKIDGPKVEIISTTKGVIDVEVTPVSGGNISSVVIANKVATSSDGLRFTTTLTSNGTYLVIATEDGGSTTRVTFTVSDIEETDEDAPVITDIHIADNKKFTKSTTETLYMEAERATQIYISVNSSEIPDVNRTSIWRKYTTNSTLKLSEGKNKIYVWCKNSQNKLSDYKMVEVVLDTVAPSRNEPTYVMSGYKITLTSNQIDTNNITVTYGYKKTTEVSYKWQDSNIIENLEPNKKYDLVTKAVDIAGNESISRSITTTEVAAIPGGVEFEVTPEGYSLNKNVKIKYPSAAKYSPYFCVYRINEGEWQIATSTEHNISVISNTKIEAAVAAKLNGVDTNYGSISRIDITTIDRVGPDISEIQKEKVNGKIDEIKLRAMIQDSGSGLVAWAITKEDIAPITWTNSFSATTNEVEATQIVTENGTYYLWAKDALGHTSYNAVDVQTLDTTDPVIKVSQIDYGESKATWNIVAQDENLGLEAYAVLKGNNVTPTESEWQKIEVTQGEYNIKYDITQNDYYTLWLRDVSGRTTHQVKEIKVLFNVTYDYKTNGGTSISISNNVVSKGCNTSVDLSPTATKDGYEFLGWNTDPNATFALTTCKVGTVEDIKLYAIFVSRIEVSLIYYEGTAKKTNTINAEAYNTESNVEITIPKIESTLDGWQQKGWATNATANAAVEYSGDNIKITTDKNMTLFMLYKKNISTTYRYYGYDTLTTMPNSDKYLYVETLGVNSYKGYYSTSEVSTGEIVTNANDVTTTTASTFKFPNIPTTVKNQSDTEWNLRGWNETTNLNVDTDFQNGDNITLDTNKIFYASYEATIKANKYTYGTSNPIVESGSAKMNYNGSILPAEIYLGTSDDVIYKNATWNLAGWNEKESVSSTFDVDNYDTVKITKDTDFYGIYKREINVNVYTYKDVFNKYTAMSYLNYKGDTLKAEITLPSLNNVSVDSRIWAPRGFCLTNDANATIENNVGDKIEIDEDKTFYISYYRNIKVDINDFNRNETLNSTAFLSENGTIKKASVNLGAIATTKYGGYDWQGAYWSTGTGADAPKAVAINESIDLLDDATFYSIFNRKVQVIKNEYNGSTSNVEGTAKLNASGSMMGAEILLSDATPVTLGGKTWSLKNWSTAQTSKDNTAKTVFPNTTISVFEDTNYYAMYGNNAEITVHYMDTTATTVSTPYSVGTILTYAGIKESDGSMTLPILSVVSKDNLTWVPLGFVNSSEGFTEADITANITNKLGEEIQPENTTQYYAMYESQATITKVERNLINEAKTTLHMNSKGNVDGAKIILGVINSIMINGGTWYGNGWSNDNTKAQNPDYTINDEITVKGNATYYASYYRDVKLELHEFNEINNPKISLSDARIYLNNKDEKVAASLTVSAPSSTSVNVDGVSWNFKGWAKDLSVDNAEIRNTSNSTISIDDNLVLYAKYTRDISAVEKTYNNKTLATKTGKAILNANGEIGDAQITLDSIDTVTLNNEEWSGRGWSTNIIANAGENFVLQGGVAVLHKDTTYYASYSKVVTVTAVSQSDTQSVVKTRNGLAYMSYTGNIIDSTIVIPSQEDYSNWTTDGYTISHEANVNDDEKITGLIDTHENVTLYGLYTREISVVFNTLGGLPKVDSQSGIQKVNSYKIADTYNPTVIIPNVELILDGKVFTNYWTPYPGLFEKEVSGGSAFELSDNYELYAYYEPKQYTITYNLNGGTGTVPSQTKEHGQEITITDVIPQKDGATFIGWTVSDDMTTTLYKPGDTFVWNGDVTLYAMYQESVYALMYDDNTMGFNRTGIVASGKNLLNKNTVWLLPDTYVDTSSIPYFNMSEKSSITEVTIEESIAPKFTAHLFDGFTSLKTINNMGELYTRYSTNADSTFLGCKSLTSIDLSGFNTSLVTDMANMFNGCESLTSIDLSKFDTSNVTNMKGMFLNCKSLTSLNVSSFDTSKVEDMSEMFAKCEKLKSLDLSNFETLNVLDMSSMFLECYQLATLNVSYFKTSKVTNMYEMFYDCQSLTALDLTRFDTKYVTNMNGMFERCKNLVNLDLTSFQTPNVADMSNMFYECNSLTSLDLSSFDTSDVTDMSNMFGSCSSLNFVDVSEFRTSKVTNMSDMFNSCALLKNADVSGFDTSNVTDMRGMFNNCATLEMLNLSSWNTQNVTSKDDIFKNCFKLQKIDIGKKCTVQTSLPTPSAAYIENADGLWYNTEGIGVTSANIPLNKAETYYASAKFTIGTLAEKNTWYRGTTDPSTITNIIVTNTYSVTGSESETWYADSQNIGTISCYVVGTSLYIVNNQYAYSTGSIMLSEDITGMFASFTNVRNINGLKLFNSVHTEIIDSLFGYNGIGCTKLLKIKDIDKWNVSNVTSAVDAFSAIGVSDIDLSNWQLDSLTDYSYMFRKTNANSVMLGNWNIIDANNMFVNSAKLQIINLSNANISNTTNTNNMFNGCEKLTTIYTLDDFNKSIITSDTSMFEGCINIIGGEGTEYDASVIGKEYANIDTDSASGYLTKYIVGAGEISAKLYDAGTITSSYTELTKEGTEATPWSYEKGERLLEIKARNLSTKLENEIKVTVPTGMYIVANSWTTPDSSTVITDVSFSKLANQGTGTYTNSQTGTLTFKVKQASTYAKVQLLVMYDTALWNKQANNGPLTIDPPVKVTLDNKDTIKINKATASKTLGGGMQYHTYTPVTKVYADDTSTELINSSQLLYTMQYNLPHFYKTIDFTSSLYSTNASGETIYAKYNGTPSYTGSGTTNSSINTENGVTKFHVENAYSTNRTQFPRPKYILPSNAGFVVGKTATLALTIKLVDFVGNETTFSKNLSYKIASTDLNYNNISLIASGATVAAESLHNGDNFQDRLGTLTFNYDSIVDAPDVDIKVEFDILTAENVAPKLKVVTYRVPITKGTSTIAKVTLIDDAGKQYGPYDYSINYTGENANGSYLYSQNVANNAGLTGTYYLKKIEYNIEYIAGGSPSNYYILQSTYNLSSAGVYVGRVNASASSKITLTAQDGSFSKVGTVSSVPTTTPSTPLYIGTCSMSSGSILAGEDFSMDLALSVYSYPCIHTQHVTKPDVYISLPVGVTINEAIYSKTKGGTKISDSQITYVKSYEEDGIALNVYKISPVSEISYGATVPTTTTNSTDLTRYLKIKLSTDESVETTTIMLKNILAIMNGTSNFGTGGSWTTYYKTDTYDLDGDGNTTEKIGTFSSSSQNIVIKAKSEE